MPEVAGPVRVSSVLGHDRERMGRHAFIGGNAFMLRLMNRHRADLGIAALSAELEATADATVRQLERDTATVAVERATLSGGMLALDVVVTNLTGHKLPTGYPSRRAWLHVTARDAGGRVLFESGRVRENGSIDGNASDADGATFEPHHAEITRTDEVQIYESIMGTPAGCRRPACFRRPVTSRTIGCCRAGSTSAPRRPKSPSWAPPRATMISVAAAIASGIACR